MVCAPLYCSRIVLRRDPRWICCNVCLVRTPLPRKCDTLATCQCLGNCHGGGESQPLHKSPKARLTQSQSTLFSFSSDMQFSLEWCSCSSTSDLDVHPPQESHSDDIVFRRLHQRASPSSRTRLPYCQRTIMSQSPQSYPRRRAHAIGQGCAF